MSFPSCVAVSVLPRPSPLAWPTSWLPRLRQTLKYSLLLGSTALLLACGGGGGSGDGPPPGAPAAPAGISLGAAGIKTLNFQWASVEGASYYRLFEDPDGGGTAPVAELHPDAAGTQITALGFTHEVPLFQRLNARYTLQACNDHGCSDDSPVFVPTVADLQAAIGYAKATGGGALNDLYGVSIALSRDGKTLAVGAVAEDTLSSNSGAAYVMRRTAAGAWGAPQKLKSPAPAIADYFGTSLALSADGSVLAVGIPNASGQVVDSGVVQMWTFNGTQYEVVQTVTAIAAAQDDGFGSAVALDDSGQVLAVGAPYQDNGGLGNVGLVHVFTRDNAGLWNDPQELMASNGAAGHLFGLALALSGDGKTLAVGVENEDGDGQGIGTVPTDPLLAEQNTSNSGAVYIFSRMGTLAGDAFTNQVYFKASNSAAGDRFGASVALSQDGSVLAVGANSEDSGTTGVAGDQTDNSADASGAAYVFVRDDSGAWSQQAYIKASNTSAGARFGSALSLSSGGDMLAVGAFNEESLSGIGLGANPNPGANAGTAEIGAVYVFRRSASAGTWSQSAYLKSPTSPSGASAKFGSAVALSGDGQTMAVGNSGENHAATDGVPKAGAPATTNGDAPQSGAVYLF